MKKKILVLAAALFCSTVFAQEASKLLTIVESQHIHELNPQLTSYSSDAQLMTGLYEGLFTYDPVNLNPKYAIAISYRISRDKKRWTFTINPDACFSNGEKITAASVRESWLMLLSTPGAPYASLLDVIMGAEEYRNGKCGPEEVGIYANTEDSLSIHLKKPANYLPKLLCHPAFSVINKDPKVYSGPFKLSDQSSEGVIYFLQKNEHYWDKENVQLEEIIFMQSNEAIDNAYLFNSGIGDWITANVDTDKLYNKKTISVSAEFATSYFFFKVNSQVWSKVEFRAALLEAVPWEILRKDSYVPATTFVYPLSGYPQVDGYSYTDAAEAKNLMKAAREKYEIPENQKLNLTIEMPENSFANDKLAALCDAWGKLGINVQVKVKNGNEYYSGVSKSDSDLFIYTWIGDFADPLAFLELFRGDSTLNDSKWKNEEYDSLIDKAAECSEEERYKLLAQAETILLDQCMVIPVHRPVIYNIIDKNVVGGWSENAFDIHPLKYL